MAKEMSCEEGFGVVKFLCGCVDDFDYGTFYYCSKHLMISNREEEED
jgi:hypothetical protein